MNSNVRPNFNEKITRKWDLWISYTVHGHKKMKSQQLSANVHMNSSHCPLIECAAAGKKKKEQSKKRWRNVNANAEVGSKPSLILFCMWP